jgi:hypothetical protein
LTQNDSKKLVLPENSGKKLQVCVHCKLQTFEITNICKPIFVTYSRIGALPAFSNGSLSRLPDGIFSDQNFPKCVKFLGPCNGRCRSILRYLVYFTAIWQILWSFGTFFPVLVCCTKENLAALIFIGICFSSPENHYPAISAPIISPRARE